MLQIIFKFNKKCDPIQNLFYNEHASLIKYSTMKWSIKIYKMEKNYEQSFS